MRRLPGENVKKNIYVFRVIALCKFGHRKRDVSKIFTTAMSFKLVQLIEDNELITWWKFKKKCQLITE